MKETRRIADQLRRAFEGEAWHGPSLRELTKDLSAAEASSRPVPGAHSIWEIVNHIAAWEAVVRRRLAGESPSLSSEENWPPVRVASETAWSATLRRAETANRDLRKAIAQFPEGRLDEERAGSGQTYYVLMHGVVQHSLYHAGQIGLLKRALAEGAKGGKKTPRASRKKAPRTSPSKRRKASKKSQ